MFGGFFSILQRYIYYNTNKLSHDSILSETTIRSKERKVNACGGMTSVASPWGGLTRHVHPIYAGSCSRDRRKSGEFLTGVKEGGRSSLLELDLGANLPLPLDIKSGKVFSFWGLCP